MFDDLGQVVRNQPSHRSSVSNTGSGENQECYHVNIKRDRNKDYAVELPIKRSLFPPPNNFSHILRSLVSIHNAKSYVYSSNFFGLKKYYSEEFNFGNAPYTPERGEK